VKRFLSLALCAVLILALLASCGGEPPPDAKADPISPAEPSPAASPNPPPEPSPPVEPSPEPPDLTALLERISGQWVDRVYYDSPTIDERVVFPFWRIINRDGIQVAYIHEIIDPFEHSGTGVPPYTTPLVIHSSQNGIVELRYGTGPIIYDHFPSYAEERASHRIVVDTQSSDIDEIKYYIGDREYTMVRHAHVPPRYQAGAIDNGIRIAWHGHVFRMGAANPDISIRIYRSAVQGEKGVLAGENYLSLDARLEWWESGYDENTRRAVYELIDTSAAPGNVYFYSLWVVSENHEMINGEVVFYAVEQDEPLYFGDTWQIRAEAG
jgi:hypothetical protein